MKKNPVFLIRSEAFRYIWLLNFAVKLLLYYELLGIPQAWMDEITASKNLLERVMTLLEKLQQAKDKILIFKDALFNQEPEYPNQPVELEVFLVELKDNQTSLPNIFSRVISVGEMIMQNPLATDTILEDLRLRKPTEAEILEATGRERKPVVGNAPVLKAKVAGDVITLTIVRGKQFIKYMANVYVSRTDKEELKYLTTTNKGSTTDRAVFAETVQIVTYTYRVQMMNGDVPVGDPSEPLIVVVKKPFGLGNGD